MPPEFARAERFDGIFMLDLPVQAEKETIWESYLRQYELDQTQKRPVDSDWTGAEIKSCCRLAALLDLPLAQAAQNIVPVAVTAADAVCKLRTWASVRCLSAEQLRPTLGHRDAATSAAVARLRSAASSCLSDAFLRSEASAVGSSNNNASSSACSRTVGDLLASSATARQLQTLGDEKLSTRVTKLWGTVRTTPADKAKLFADYRKKLSPISLANADLALGRAVFQKTCANCHQLFDAGGAIGPNLTGSQRTNLDYLLENMIDPSASVAKDFQVQVITTDNGRTLTGIVIAENANAVTLQTQNEKLVIPLAEIEERTPSPQSMMPEGILTPLSLDEVRGLLGYLGSPQQVPLKEP